MSINKELHKAHVAILHVLLFKRDARFAHLQKTSKLSSDHFNFYLKQLLQDELIAKNAQGAYHLTAKGKEFANRFDTQARTVERQPKVAVCLVVERDDGTVLAQQRLKQPYYGYWGRVTGKLAWGETILQAAARELKEETGLRADLKLAEINHKMDYNKQTGDILEDKIFFIVRGTNPIGKLVKNFEGGRNQWMTPEELASQPLSFLGKDNGFVHASTTPGLALVEARHEYSPDSY